MRKTPRKHAGTIGREQKLFHEALLKRRQASICPTPELLAQHGEDITLNYETWRENFKNIVIAKLSAAHILNITKKLEAATEILEALDFYYDHSMMTCILVCNEIGLNDMAEKMVRHAFPNRTLDHSSEKFLITLVNEAMSMAYNTTACHEALLEAKGILSR